MAQYGPFAPAQIDFSRIGRIADSYYGAKNDAMKRQAFAEQQDAERAARARDDALRSEMQSGDLFKDGRFDSQMAAERILRTTGNVDQAAKIMAANGAPKSTALMKNLSAAGLRPGTPEYEKAVLDHLSRPQTSINMGQEKAYDRKVGEALGEESVGIQKRGAEAATRIGRYRQLGHLLKDPNVYTGTMSESVVNPLKKAGKTLFGLDLEGVGSAEAAASITKELAAEIATKFKPVSNFEVQFAQSILPNLSNSAEGNALLVDLGVRLAEREQKIAQAARAYRAQKGRLDEGWYARLAEFEKANPLVTEEIMQRAQAAASRAPQQPPLAGAAPRVTSDAEFDALPSGATFIDPHGKMRRKP